MLQWFPKLCIILNNCYLFITSGITSTDALSLSLKQISQSVSSRDSILSSNSRNCIRFMDAMIQATTDENGYVETNNYFYNMLWLKHELILFPKDGKSLWTYLEKYTIHTVHTKRLQSLNSACLITGRENHAD